MSGYCIYCYGAGDPELPHAPCSRQCDNRRKRASPLEQARRRDPIPDGVRDRIFARDDWTCWLCGEETSHLYRQGDPSSPTLDHVLPVALIGRPVNEPWNLKLAHLSCNMARGRAMNALMGTQP